MCVVSIINVHQWMLGGCFEGYIVNWYGSSHVIGNELKFINCDFTYSSSNMIVTLNKGSPKLLLHSPIVWMLDCTYIHVLKIYVTFINKLEKMVWSFVLRDGANIIIEPIDPFLVSLCFVALWSIEDFI